MLYIAWAGLDPTSGLHVFGSLDDAKRFAESDASHHAEEHGALTVDPDMGWRTDPATGITRGRGRAPYTWSDNGQRSFVGRAWTIAPADVPDGNGDLIDHLRG